MRRPLAHPSTGALPAQVGGRAPSFLAMPPSWAAGKRENDSLLLTSPRYHRRRPSQAHKEHRPRFPGTCVRIQDPPAVKQLPSSRVHGSAVAGNVLSHAPARSCMCRGLATPPLSPSPAPVEPLSVRNLRAGWFHCPAESPSGRSAALPEPRRNLHSRVSPAHWRPSPIRPPTVLRHGPPHPCCAVARSTCQLLPIGS